jgi:hypothetical protein
MGAKIGEKPYGSVRSGQRCETQGVMAKTFGTSAVLFAVIPEVFSLLKKTGLHEGDSRLCRRFFGYWLTV